MQFAFILFIGLLAFYFVSISLILFNIGKIASFFFHPSHSGSTICVRYIIVLYLFIYYGTFGCYPSIYFGDFNGGLHWCLIIHLKYKTRTVDDTTVSLKDLNGGVAVDELLHLFYYELLNASRIWVF